MNNDGGKNLTKDMYRVICIESYLWYLMFLDVLTTVYNTYNGIDVSITEDTDGTIKRRC
jgi:hypothetical protein